MNMISMKIVFLLALINIIFVNNTVFGATKKRVRRKLIKNWENCPNIYPFTVYPKVGDGVIMESYKNKVLLIFNFSTRHRITTPYHDLMKLADKQNDYFQLIGFECETFNYDFQEDSDEPLVSSDFMSAEKHIDVYFSMFMNSNGTTQLWKYLELRTITNVIKNGMRPFLDENKSNKPETIKGIYTVFIVDKDGIPKSRFEPGWTLEEITEALHNELIRPSDGASPSNSMRLFGKTITQSNEGNF